VRSIRNILYVILQEIKDIPARIHFGCPFELWCNGFALLYRLGGIGEDDLP
jgi:hypothetical protein